MKGYQNVRFHGFRKNGGVDRRIRHGVSGVRSGSARPGRCSILAREMNLVTANHKLLGVFAHATVRSNVRRWKRTMVSRDLAGGVEVKKKKKKKKNTEKNTVKNFSGPV